MKENSDLLRGWKEIEQYTRSTRKKLLRNNYPVREEPEGSVIAFKTEIDSHMRQFKLIVSALLLQEAKDARI